MFPKRASTFMPFISCTVTINDQIAERVQSFNCFCFKVLEVTIDDRQKWTKHVDIIVDMAFKRLHPLVLLRKSGLPPPPSATWCIFITYLSEVCAGEFRCGTLLFLNICQVALGESNVAPCTSSSLTFPTPIPSRLLPARV